MLREEKMSVDLKNGNLVVHGVATTAAIGACSSAGPSLKHHEKKKKKPRKTFKNYNFFPFFQNVMVSLETVWTNQKMVEKTKQICKFI